MKQSQPIIKQTCCNLCYLLMSIQSSLKDTKVSTDEQPWISHKLKQLDRRSEKWQRLNKEIKQNVKHEEKKIPHTGHTESLNRCR